MTLTLSTLPALSWPGYAVGFGSLASFAVNLVAPTQMLGSIEIGGPPDDAAALLSDWGRVAEDFRKAVEGDAARPAA